MRNCIPLLLIFALSPALADTQYRPTASPLNHGLSGGWILGPFERGRTPFSAKSLFLTYTYYVTDRWMPETYQGYVTGGLELKSGWTQVYGDCVGYQSHPIPLKAGLKLRMTYWEKVQPFVGISLMKVFCQKSFGSFKESSKKTEYIFPFGLSVSLKAIDSRSVYSLDEDYGLNDLSLLVRCFRAKIKNKSKSRFICEAGLEALF